MNKTINKFKWIMNVFVLFANKVIFFFLLYIKFKKLEVMN